MAALAAANGTHIVRVSLIIVVDVAIVEIDVPRVVCVVGVCSTGPVVVGHAVQKKNVRLLNCLGARSPIIRVQTLAFSYHIGEADA